MTLERGRISGSFGLLGFIMLWKTVLLRYCRQKQKSSKKYWIHLVS